MSGWVRLVARFPGICIVCGKPTKVGVNIRYAPGRGVGTQVAHDRCKIVGELTNRRPIDRRLAQA